MNQDNFISFNEIVRINCDKPMDVISKDWLCSSGTLDFLRIWELKNNPNFNTLDHAELSKMPKNIKLKQWIDKTNAVSFTFVKENDDEIFMHPDIAFDFLIWAVPQFRADFIIDDLPHATRTLLLDNYQTYGQYQSWHQQIDRTPKALPEKEKKKDPKQQLADDVSFYWSICILRELLKRELITKEEYERIREISKERYGSNIYCN